MATENPVLSELGNTLEKMAIILTLLDKYFSLNSSSTFADVVEQVKELRDRPQPQGFWGEKDQSGTILMIASAVAEDVQANHSLPAVLSWMKKVLAWLVDEEVAEEASKWGLQKTRNGLAEVRHLLASIA